jgi:hypothetical protein
MDVPVTVFGDWFLKGADRDQRESKKQLGEAHPIQGELT